MIIWFSAPNPPNDLNSLSRNFPLQRATPVAVGNGRFLVKPVVSLCHFVPRIAIDFNIRPSLTWVALAPRSRFPWK
jgi:hypothetical protein